MSVTSPDHTRSKFQRLKELRKADPANPALSRDCIALAAQLGDFDFILQDAEATLTNAPRDPSARFDRATAFIGKKDYGAAIDILRELRAELADRPEIGRDLGLCYYCLGDYSKARPELAAAHTGGDRSPDLLRLLISTLHHLGAIDEAVAIVDENRDAAVNNGALAGVYALLYLDAGLSPQAAKWATAALRQNPDSVDGLVVQGTLAVERMNIDAATAHYERAVELAPAAGRAWLGLGTIALLGQDLERAKPRFVQALEYMPGHVGSWHVLAWTHILSGDVAAAEAAFQRSLEIDRNFAETHGGLAATAALRGDHAAARRLIEVAQRLDPRCLSAQFAESVLAGQTGDAERAGQTLLNAAASLADTQSSALGKVLKRASLRFK